MTAGKTPPQGRKRTAAKKAGPKRAHKSPKRGSSAAAEQGPHTPKVGGSTPPPATKKRKPGSSTAEHSPDKREVAGSTPAPATRKPRPKKAAVAQSGEHGPVTPEAAGSKPAGGANSTTTAAELLARRPAPDREQPLTPTEEAFITEYLRNNQNGTAAWIFTHPGTPPDRAAVYAYRLVRKRQVAERIASERSRLARQHEITRDQLLAEFLAIARADPNELVQMRAVACAKCWGGAENRGRWTEPDPECEDCLGDGHAVPWIADTRKLSREARALYAGIHQTKEGIKILMHDKVAALVNAGKIIGAFELDNKQKDQTTAEVLRSFFAGLHSAGERSGLGLPIVAPADVPRQQRAKAKG